jgi:hypothetical protein
LADYDDDGLLVSPKQLPRGTEHVTGHGTA